MFDDVKSMVPLVPGTPFDPPEDGAHFDAGWYSAEYPDVAFSGLSPLEHYMRFGRFLNRRPSRDGAAAQAFAQSGSHPPSQAAAKLAETPVKGNPVAAPEHLHESVAEYDADSVFPPPRRGTGTLRGGFNLPGAEVPLIRGWLAKTGDDRPRTALIQVDARRRLEIVCDGFRNDLLENGINAGRHGFELILPIDVIDGCPHALKLIDKETGRLLAEETASWTQQRHFSDFGGFLAHSIVSPLIYAPFREEDKRCFAVMENIADRLAALAADAASAPLVSVILPVHNRCGTVREAIDSVLNQSYENVELIVIDDGSTDGSAELLREIEAKEKRVILLRHAQRRGVSSARNRGLAEARGELVCYLDSDNTWDWRYIAATVGAFRHLPDAQAIYGGQMLFRGRQRQPFAVRFGSLNKGLLENRNYIDLNAFAHRRDALDVTGWFDEALARFVDWDFILRMTEAARVLSVPVLLSHYCFDKVPDTLTNASDLYGQIGRVRENMRGRSGLAEARKARSEPKSGELAAAPTPNVSIIIPSYEALPDLMECIASIRALRTELRVRIIVIDNASGGEVHRYLEGLAAGGLIRYLRNPRNYGFTRAVNQGLMMADPQSDVVLLNNDATLAPDALDALNAAAYRLPGCGMVVPRQVLPGGTRTICDHVPYACPEQDCDVNLSIHHANALPPPVFHDGEQTELSFAPFFCVYIKREVLDLAPQLDERHGRHYRSDRIYCDYVRNVFGYRLYHVSAAVARHKLQRATDALQVTSGRPGSEFEEICIRNAWSEELAGQLGHLPACWERATPDSDGGRY